jgi:SEC-C motif-containing protein
MPPAPNASRGFGRRPWRSQPSACPCGGGAYQDCCGPLIAGKRFAATAEQLMRSRYSAVALAAQEPEVLEHLLRTHPHGDQSAAAQRKALRASCRTIQWLSLTVLDRQHGTHNDQSTRHRDL